MKNLRLQRLTDHVYTLPPDAERDRPILGVISGKEISVIVDAGNSPAHARELLREIGRLKLPPPRYLVITHWHWDHVFGIATFNLPTMSHALTQAKVKHLTKLDWSDQSLEERVARGEEIAFCQRMIQEELPDRRKLVLKAPDLTFEERLTIDLGEVTCRIEHVGGDHAADSAVVYVPEDGVVFLGDALCTDIYQGERSWNREQLFPLIDKLIAYEAVYYVDAHSPQPVFRKEMFEYTAAMRKIGNVVYRTGDNREQVLEKLGQMFGKTLTPEQIEIVDGFLAGIRKRGWGEKRLVQES